MVASLENTRSAQSFFTSIGVVSHVILPSQQVESDAAPALTAVGEAGKEIIEERYIEFCFRG